MERIAYGLGNLGEWSGKDFVVSEWTTITQEQINEFASCTGDHQRIHVDV